MHPNWLKDLVPVFADPKVGMIQAPQDHRDGERSAMHHAMNGEYAGFFDIGMVQRNEKNAIIAHGTMCLIRRSALVAAGNWSSDTICEDTDLGLTILELGFAAHYTNRRYGYGLLPDSYLAYKRQRDRWAYGGFQIMKKHWRRFLPGRSLLDARAEARIRARLAVLARRRERRRAGRAAQPDLGAVRRHRRHRHSRQDSDHPDPRRLRGGGRCISSRSTGCASGIPGGQMFGAVFAAMALQWTVARAVGYGLIKDGLPFVRTAKGGSGRRSADFPAFWEAVIGALLVGSAIFLHATNWELVREIDLFALALAIQSLPFLASVALAVLEGSRVNDFAFWHGLEARLGQMLTRRPAARQGSGARAVSAEKQIEPAQ